MPFHQQQLPNGLNIIAESDPAMHSVAFGFWVRTGSRDEKAEVSGVSHFLEHMVFKGTERRDVHAVNRDFDRIGADYNAYTSEENTVFHATVLPEYLPDAIDLLADIMRPSLREDDFDMEKNVILEEIARYDDQPMSVAYERARELHYGSHPLANSVLGTPESITKLKCDQMVDYFNRRYAPSNITVVAAGRLNWKSFVKLIKDHCGRWQSGTARRTGLRETTGTGDFAVHTKDSVAQEQLMLVSGGPPAKSKHCYAASLLSVIVGDYTGSRLYWSLVDKGLAEGAGMSFDECDGTGAFWTWLACEPEKTQKILNLVQRILLQVRLDGVSEEEVAQAKNKVLARLVRSAERPMGRMQSLGHNWIYTQRYRSVDDEMKAYNSVTPRGISTLLEKYPIDRVTTLALGPLTGLRRSGKGKRRG